MLIVNVFLFHRSPLVVLTEYISITVFSFSIFAILFTKVCSYSSFIFLVVIILNTLSMLSLHLCLLSKSLVLCIANLVCELAISVGPHTSDLDTIW